MSGALNYDLKPESDAIVAEARSRGALVRPVECEACGTPNSPTGRSSIHLHHHDYSKPLDMIPLCPSCHSRVHHGRIPEPRTGRVYERTVVVVVAAPVETATQCLFRLPKTLKAAAKRRAGERDMTVAQYLRALLRADLKGCEA